MIRSLTARPALWVGLVLAAPTVLLASLPAEASKRRGVQRKYVGARWAPAEQSLGWAAELRLDKAVARDYKKGGFIAQTLWAATNEGKTAYGRNRRAPYLQVSLTRGYRGHNRSTVVVAERTTSGRYYESESRGPSIMGRDVAVSIAGQIGGVWTISVDHEDLGKAEGLGDSPRSHSAFAGIESSSSKNRAKGAVKELYWIVEAGKAAAPFPKWRVGNHEEEGARLVKRGPGRAKWTDKQFSLKNSFDR